MDQQEEAASVDCDHPPSPGQPHSMLTLDEHPSLEEAGAVPRSEVEVVAVVVLEAAGEVEDDDEFGDFGGATAEASPMQNPMRVDDDDEWGDMEASTSSDAAASAFQQSPTSASIPARLTAADSSPLSPVPPPRVSAPTAPDADPDLLVLSDQEFVVAAEKVWPSLRNQLPTSDRPSATTALAHLRAMQMIPLGAGPDSVFGQVCSLRSLAIHVIHVIHVSVHANRCRSI